MREQVERAIEWSVSRQRIDLVLPKFWHQSARLGIIKGQWGYHVHLAEIVTRNSLQASEIDQPNSPWEIPIEGEEITLEKIAKSLPPFFLDFYPQVEGLPIHIFRSRKDYLGNVPPAARIAFVGNTFTINTDLP